jgi:hypothetical protein
MNPWTRGPLIPFSVHQFNSCTPPCLTSIRLPNGSGEAHSFGMRLAIPAILLFTLALGAQTRIAPFPPIGGGRHQSAHIHVIALGTADTQCRAALGFRSVKDGGGVGPVEVSFLRIGQMKSLSIALESLGIADGERAELLPIVELADPLSHCFAAIEIKEKFQVINTVFVSGSTLSPTRPVGGHSPFVVARRTENIQLSVTRIQVNEADPPPCEILMGFRDAGGEVVGEERTVSLLPAATEQVTFQVKDAVDPADTQRILLTVRPVRDGSGVGCAAAAQVYEAHSGNTTRYVPLSVSATTEPLTVPPASATRTEPLPELPPVGGPMPIGARVTISAPRGLPPVPYPPDNPPTAETMH